MVWSSQIKPYPIDTVLWLTIEFGTQVRCSYGRGLNPQNSPPLATPLDADVDVDVDEVDKDKIGLFSTCKRWKVMKSSQAYLR